jgi:ABC-type ATPase involved in cell division
MNNKIKECFVDLDEITLKFAEAFDYNFNGKSTFTLPDFNPPSDFNIGLIVGNSGSGKSLLLKEYFQEPSKPEWTSNKSIVSHFNSYEEACEKLFAVGLSSVPTICRPYHVLSNGEKYRADVSRCLKDYSVIDEFTSVVNRETAYGICVAIKKYIKTKNIKNVVLASCHFDIVDWLSPDWVFNTNNNDFIVNGFSLSQFTKLGEINIQ